MKLPKKVEKSKRSVWARNKRARQIKFSTAITFIKLVNPVSYVRYQKAVHVVENAVHHKRYNKYQLEEACKRYRKYLNLMMKEIRLRLRWYKNAKRTGEKIEPHFEPRMLKIEQQVLSQYNLIEEAEKLLE